MKKSLIALAALAAAGAASAQTANAQNPGASAVTIFGVIDVAVSRQTNENDVRLNQLAGTGRNASSRLGFRGVEDLGGGLGAAFWLEAGLNVDSGTGQQSSADNNTAAGGGGGSQGLTFNRASTVSLLGRSFGEVRLGRDYAPYFWNQTSFDPFGTVGVGASTNISQALSNFPVLNGTGGANNVIPVTRTSNSIAWLSPNFGGFRGQLQYAFGERAAPAAAGTSTSDGRSAGLRLSYANGPIAGAFAYQDVKYTSTTTTGNNKLWNLGGSYDFGVARLMAQYGRQKVDLIDGTTDAEAKYWGLGTIVPFGPLSLKGSYFQTKRDDIGGREQNQLALGVQYDLSKRTALYGTYSRMKVDSGAVAATNFGFSGSTTTIGANTSGTATGLDLGVRHSF